MTRRTRQNNALGSVDADGRLTTLVLDPASAVTGALADRYISSYANAPVSKLTMLPTQVNGQWQGFNGGTNVVTARGFEYVAYVRSDNHIVIAQRVAGSKVWTVTDLNSFFGAQVADGHNVTSIAVDANGYIHVSGNMHNVALMYIRSNAPDSIAAFTARTMIGTEEDSVTYPIFVSRAGLLYFTYRNGVSGAGDFFLNSYNPATQTWTRRAKLFALASGGSTFSAYPSGPHIDATGSMHMSFVWRDTGFANTTRDVGYIKSDDGGTTWKNAAGVTQTLPITFDTSPTVFSTPATDSGLLNTQLTVTLDGVVHIDFLYYDANGASNVMHLWLDGTGWHNEFVTFGKARMATNVGILDSSVGRAGIVSYKNEVYAIWRSSMDGKGGQIRAIDISKPGSPFEFPISEIDVGAQEPVLWDDGAIQNSGVVKFLLTTQPPGGQAGGANYGSQWAAIFEMQLNRLKYVGSLQAGRAKVIPIATFSIPSSTVTVASAAAVPGVPNWIISPALAGQTVLIRLRHRIRSTTGATAGGVGTWAVSQYDSGGGNLTDRIRVLVSTTGAVLLDTPWVPLDMTKLTTGGWLELRAFWTPASGDTTHGTNLTIGQLEIGLLQDANGDYL